jgi:uncharacterized membrane protein YphA (DoxX/SURF4 family)
MPSESTNTINLANTTCRVACNKSSWIKAIPWIAQVIVAIILAQTLFFKFTYAPETQVIFAERGGRLAATAVGIMELVCVVLLLIPSTASIGSALSLVVISGATFTHLTSLGIQIRDPITGESDGGFLFALALSVAVGSLVVLAFRWRELPFVRSWVLHG